MTTRKIHPNKEIEKAIQYAESRGWRYKKSGDMSVWSTPSNAENHAKLICRRVDSCPHYQGS